MRNFYTTRRVAEVIVDTSACWQSYWLNRTPKYMRCPSDAESCKLSAATFVELSMVAEAAQVIQEFESATSCCVK